MNMSSFLKQDKRFRWIGVTIVSFFFIFQALPLLAATCAEVAVQLNGPGAIGVCKASAPECSGDAGQAVDGSVHPSSDCTYAAPQEVCCIQAAKPAGTPAPSSQGTSIALFDPLNGIGLIGIINRLVTGFLSIVGALSLLVFVYAGVMYMASGSSETRLKKAKETMKYGAIGLAIIMLSYTITRVYFRILTEEPAAIPVKPAAVSSTSG